MSKLTSIAVLFGCAALVGCLPPKKETIGRDVGNGNVDISENVSNCVAFYSAYAQYLMPSNPALAQQYDRFAAPNVPAAVVAEMTIAHRGIDFSKLSVQERNQLFVTGIHNGSQSVMRRVGQWQQFFTSGYDATRFAATSAECNQISPLINESTARLRQNPIYTPLFSTVQIR